ncbi:hypothetical protein ACFX16_040066 [Malus domestica]
MLVPTTQSKFPRRNPLSLVPLLSLSLSLSQLTSFSLHSLLHFRFRKFILLRFRKFAFFSASSSSVPSPCSSLLSASISRSTTRTLTPG